MVLFCELFLVRVLIWLVMNFFEVSVVLILMKVCSVVCS